MAISLGYVAKETATNLRRNLLMTVAAVLTVGVSLSLVGGALLLKQGVTKATIQWRGGVELNVFMKVDSTEEQNTAVDRQLREMREVKKVTYVSQQEAFEEFGKLFENQPEMRDSITPADLPPSYRVVPHNAELVDVIGERFESQPGVQEVVYAKDTIAKLLDVTRTRQVLFFVLAAVCLMAASLLIFITIQMAIFARRREVAVMKLVGATNWFIRVPFMLEGMTQGLVGGLIAFGAIFGLRNWIIKLAIDPSLFFDQIHATAQDAIGTGLFLMAVGATVGAVGSAVAVRRFLEV